DLVAFPALAPEHEADRGPSGLGVRVAQRRQAVRVIGARVFLVADSNERFLKKLDNSGQHPRTRQAGPREVGTRSLTNPGQGAREEHQPSVLGLVAHLPPSRVIPILLASLRIASGRLQMPARVGCNPDVS